MSERGVALEVPTLHGPGRVRLHGSGDAAAALVLGHGAGGGIDAPDLGVATEVALELGWAVALVEQPYRVAGRRSPPPAGRLDAAWVAIVEHLRAGPLAGAALVTGGRSSGARVACRTAAATGSAGVLCLAFPLRPPRPGAPSRLPELAAVTVPVLVVQGRRDPFGVPRSAGARRVVRVDADHGLKSDLAAVATAIGRWLPSVAGSPGGPR